MKPEDYSLPINWVELKTAEEIRSDRDLLKFERKLLKFWIQSFLLGVPKIVVGFRSKDGYLMRIQEIETRTIPGAVKRKGKDSWDGNTCINFAAAFLDCKCFVEFLISIPMAGRLSCGMLTRSSLERYNYRRRRLED